MNNDAHRGYDSQVEDEKEKQFQMMKKFSPDPGQSVIDEWSRETREAIRTPGDFDAWVFGMVKLYRTQSGDR